MNKQYSKNKDDKEVEIPFTMVSNFSLDTIHLRTPAENCLYFVIIRQTIGYLTQSGERKKNASLSISRLMQLTNLSRQGVLNARRKLFENRWIMYKLFGGMTSYAIIDRYEEFRKKQESTDLTNGSQLSLPDQSNDLTDASQLSRHIKEKEIKALKKEKETLPDTPLPEKPKEPFTQLTTSNLREMQNRLSKINASFGFTYIESGKANQLLDKAIKSFSGDFLTFFNGILDKLDRLTSRKIDTYQFNRSFTIESLTQFNCKDCSKVEAWYNKEFGVNKASNVTQFPIKQEPIRPTYDEKNVEEFMRSFK